MRTTIRLNDDLAVQAREMAARTGKTFTALVEDGLRLVLARERQAAHASVELPSMGGNGLQPGVDLDDSASLLDLMEAPTATD